MNERLQLYGLGALSALASGLLILIGVVVVMIGRHISPDGRVPSAEAFGLTALLLSFREVIASIRGIWDTEARTTLTAKLAASSPAGGDPQPVTVTNGPSEPVPTADVASPSPAAAGQAGSDAGPSA